MSDSTRILLGTTEKHMVFEISAAEVEQLGADSFVDFVNHLLQAEGRKLGIPSSQIRTSSKLTAADEGIDAFIDDSELIDGKWIPPGESAWQFKTGNAATDPEALAKEAQKPGILRTLRSGGRYAMAMSRKCNSAMKARREAAIKKALLKMKVPSDRFRLLAADEMAEWASEHPSIILLPVFRRSIGSCMRLDQWQKDQRHQGRFVPDENRKNIISEIRSFVTTTKGNPHFRLLGRQGVGKTRLVMESLSAQGIGERAIYAQDSQGFPSELWGWLRDFTVTSAIVVVDECDGSDAEKLQAQADACGGRVRLITIGVGEPFLSQLSPRSHRFLDKMEEASMRELLQARAARLSQEQIDWVVRITAGYVKLAVTCAETLAMIADADVAQLVKSLEVRDILTALLPNQTDRKVMQVLSLLTKVGFEGDVIAEAKTLAEFAEVGWSDFVDTTDRMFQKGLVGKRGRYRYVTPDLLAQWLAADLWRVRSDDVRALPDLLPEASSKESFYDRLKDLGSDEKSGLVLRGLVSKEGISDIRTLDSEAISRFVYGVALAHPKLGLETLVRLLGNATTNQLQLFSHGRLYTIMALNYLKWFKDTFREAAALLLVLAETENETYGNNATETWTGLFRLRLGGTEVPVLDRLSLLEEILSRNSSVRKRLALGALKTLLSSHEIRFSSSETAGPRPVPGEWHPKTWGEIWAAYRFALQLIDRALGDPDAAVSREARDVLRYSARTLVNSGLAGEILPRLEAYVPENEEERRKARETLRILLGYENEKLTEEQRKQLITIEEKITGTDYPSRLRRWIGQWSFGDWSIHERDGGPPPQERVASLADETVVRPDQLTSELEWLLSDQAHNIALFGKRLGELDVNRTMLDQIIDKTRNGGRPTLLASYLWGRNESGDKQVVEDLLKEWAGSDRCLAQTVVATTRNLEPSDSALERVIGLVENGWLQRKDLVPLVWSKWSERLPWNGFQRLIESLLLDDTDETLQAILYALNHRLQLHLQEKTALSPLVWKALERSSSTDGLMSHLWEEIGKNYAESDSIKIAELIVKLFEDENVLLSEEDSPMKVLAAATQADERGVWKVIGSALLPGDSRAYRLRMGLQRWYVHLVSSGTLLNWAEGNTPIGPRVLAILTEPSGTPLWDLPRELLERYGIDEQVPNELQGNFRTGAFSGNMSNWLQKKLEIAQEWKFDPSPQVRRWAENVIEGMQSEIHHWKTREAEEDLI